VIFEKGVGPTKTQSQHGSLEFNFFVAFASSLKINVLVS